jgi:hypothetical protein
VPGRQGGEAARLDGTPTNADIPNTHAANTTAKPRLATIPVPDIGTTRSHAFPGTGG